MFSIPQFYNVQIQKCQSIAQHFILYTIKIVNCQGDMFRSLLGCLQALWENRSKSYLYFNALWDPKCLQIVFQECKIHKSVYVTLKDRKRSLSGKKTTTRCVHYRNSYNAKLRVGAVFKQPQRVVAWEKQPQREMSFILTVYKFSNLLIKKIHVT